MADGTHIEWTDATWNPITGCSVVSAGCKHCYAMKLAGTRLKHTPSREGLTIETKAGPVWNGQVRFNAQWLDQPLRWIRPRRIFVCAHGDLFHESVPDEWIDQVFAVMALAPHHTFQVLTKRAERMRAYFASMPDRSTAIEETELFRAASHRVGCDDDPNGSNRHHAETARFERGIGAVGRMFSGRPLPNVWLGVSIEDQGTANDRIPQLLDCPAAVRWVSVEPLLGPIDLEALNCASMYDECYDLPDGRGRFNSLSGWAWNESPNDDGTWSDNCVPPEDRGRGNGRKGQSSLDWVVAGGESGTGARPVHTDWLTSLRDQCAVERVPFLFKQWGEWLPADRDSDGVRHVMYPTDGGDATRFQGLGPRRCMVADGQEFWRVGKKLSGRLLDGVLHDEFPEVRHG